MSTPRLTEAPPSVDSGWSKASEADNYEDSAKDPASIRTATPTTVSFHEPHTPAVDRPVETESLSSPVHTPRNPRRGLLPWLCFIREVEQARTHDRKTKWFLTSVVALACMIAPMGLEIFYPSLESIAADFHTTTTLTNLSIALYLLSMAFFPLWWSSFSEVFGRRSIYIISFTFLALFNALSAVSSSISMLIIMRLLAGGAASSVQTVGAGTIADLWEPKERGRAMGYFFLGPLCGPLFAPILGGVLADRWDWRSTMWFMMVLGCICLILIIFGLPETIAHKQKIPSTETNLPPPSQRKRRLRNYTAALTGPLKIGYYLKFPVVMVSVYYAAVTYGMLLVQNVSIQQTFSQPPYNFSTLLVGLCYIPNSIGLAIICLFGGSWTDRIMAREARKANRYDEKGGLIYLPEDRMKENAWIGATLLPSALLWYGWTAHYGVFWLCPLISTFFFGVGLMLIFAVTTTMLTEFMPKHFTAGTALTVLFRSIFGCVGAVASAPVLDALGNGWTFTILAVVGYLSVFVVVLTKWKRHHWREVMDRELNAK